MVAANSSGLNCLLGGIYFAFLSPGSFCETGVSGAASVWAGWATSPSRMLPWGGFAMSFSGVDIPGLWTKSWSGPMCRFPSHVGWP